MKVNDIELVPVTSGDKRYQIDLDDNRIYTKYLQLCEDYASYWLDVLKNDMSQIMMSNIFVGLILHIIKREYQEDCNAGFSFCVSPDLKAYPCHVCAGEAAFGIKYDKDFRKKIKVHVNFQKVISIEKSKLKECSKCIAKNLCSYICKGLSVDNKFVLPRERCLMMEVFLKKSDYFFN